jgi:2-amino-4-hydroxy-6-hydroxymethyldihydropteridine diphosphokinase
VIYLSLGSNLGDREANFRNAIAALEAAGVHVLRVSPVYETEPVDYLDQPWFLNLVIEADSVLTPQQLLDLIGCIERELGRVRDVPKGPRTLDIDILFYGNGVLQSPDLEIPHPRIADRRFVLAPLADLAPDLRHPLTGRTVSEMLQNAPPAALRLLHS